MRALLRTVGLLILVVMFPSVVFAQASIIGVVRDTSGAVLPGVTVEAASPALIEKVRTAVTDGTGQYRIENLRPGLYSIVPVYTIWRRPQSILLPRFAKISMQFDF